MHLMLSTTINPAVVLKIRSLILEIIKQAILLKQVFVNKEKVHLWSTMVKKNILFSTQNITIQEPR
jgi:hypothetical protein